MNYTLIDVGSKIALCLGCRQSLAHSPGQNGHRLADDICKRIILYEKLLIEILIEISLKFVPKGPIDNNPTLVQIMAWRRIGDKPLSEPMFTRFTDAYMRH